MQLLCESTLPVVKFRILNLKRARHLGDFAQSLLAAGNVLFGLCSRDDIRPHASMKTVDIKILAVHSEELPNAFTLSNSNKCRIGKVHRTVGVLAHELAHSRNVSEIER